MQNSPSGQVWKFYYYAGAQRVAMRVTGSANPLENGLFYTLGDNLGSTSLVTDAGGNKVSEMRYEPWGETRYENGVTLTDFRYTGQREEEGIGLYFYGARWYDQNLGRFAQDDTILTGGTSGFDRYAYVDNSPIQKSDPTGHSACNSGNEYVDDQCRQVYITPEPVVGTPCWEIKYDYARVECRNASKPPSYTFSPEGEDNLIFEEVEVSDPDVVNNLRKDESDGNCTYGPHAIVDERCWENFPLPDYKAAVIKTLKEINEIILENIWTPLTQNQYDALVCLLWNVGADNLTSLKSTSGGPLLEAINREPPHFDEAADIIANYIPGKSTLWNPNPRARESDLYKNGVYNTYTEDIYKELKIYQ
jgi:RHS repeat-associated protein